MVKLLVMLAIAVGSGIFFGLNATALVVIAIFAGGRCLLCGGRFDG